MSPDDMDLVWPTAKAAEGSQSQRSTPLLTLPQTRKFDTTPKTPEPDRLSSICPRLRRRQSAGILWVLRVRGFGGLGLVGLAPAGKFLRLVLWGLSRRTLKGTSMYLGSAGLCFVPGLRTYNHPRNSDAFRPVQAGSKCRTASCLRTPPPQKAK